MPRLVLQMGCWYEKGEVHGLLRDLVQFIFRLHRENVRGGKSNRVVIRKRFFKVGALLCS